MKSNMNESAMKNINFLIDNLNSLLDKNAESEDERKDRIKKEFVDDLNTASFDNITALLIFDLINNGSIRNVTIDL